jgi:hypothetical protein
MGRKKSKSVKKQAAQRVGHKRPAKKTRPDALDVFIVAAARTLDLPAQKKWLPAIKANLKVTLQHAQTVSAFRLPDGAEPAPVFKA